MMETCSFPITGLTPYPVEFDGINTRTLAVVEEQEVGE